MTELSSLADQVMLKKAYALLLLKWRGQRIPSLAELENEARVPDMFLLAHLKKGVWLMASMIQRGYFILADISGYTSFMASNELDHVQGILNNIVTLIIRHLTPTLTLVEVEGDAVFVYTPLSKMPRGETLLELVETTYVKFRDRQKTMQRNATCACSACQAIPSLDLKFVIHYGEYILQDVMGHDKPIGSCVNLAHRLLKNKVSDATGWRGYALCSEESLKQMEVWPNAMHSEVETYEHLGEVQTYSMNLDARYKELTEDRRTLLRAEEADVTLTHQFPAPLPLYGIG